MVNNMLLSNLIALEDFLGVSGVSSLKIAKRVVNESDILKKVLCNSIIDVEEDLDAIVRMFKIAFSTEDDIVEDNIVEMDMLVNFYYNPTIDIFKRDMKVFLTLSFFAQRYLKFNDYILK